MIEYEAINKGDLINYLEGIFIKDIPYALVHIKNLEEETEEVIVIPHKDIPSKIRYYEKAYSNDLKLRTFNKIIIDDCYSSMNIDILDKIFKVNDN